MMAATIPGIAAMVSRKIARLRILSLVINPKFHNVAEKRERKEIEGGGRVKSPSHPRRKGKQKTMSRESMYTTTTLTGVERQPHALHGEERGLVAEGHRFPVRNFDVEIFFRILSVGFREPCFGEVEDGECHYLDEIL
jgi:hypothetical protein